ncbi:MAG: enoyl-CoA hydratase/isomerase family protein, partial [Kangiella sp.]|nr:enoyl-CoA hydratase/isomerase family protein [Kangiella sp.]
MSQAAATQTDTSHECFDVEIKDHIAHIRLSRPQVANAMNKTFWNELPAIVRDIDENARARVIVLSAEGKHFSAGMDLSVFGSGTDKSHVEAGRRRERMMQTVLMLQKTFSCLEEARMPVLAAINGACVGGGMDFTSAADMRYCTKDAFFCIAEINIDMTADVGTFPRMGYVMPPGLVRELAFTGRRMYAAQAKACAFAHEVY